jgi:hypothetical protein
MVSRPATSMVRPDTGGTDGTPFIQPRASRREIILSPAINDPRLNWSKTTQEPFRCQTVFDIVSIVETPNFFNHEKHERHEKMILKKNRVFHGQPFSLLGHIIASNLHLTFFNGTI